MHCQPLDPGTNRRGRQRIVVTTAGRLLRVLMFCCTCWLALSWLLPTVDGSARCSGVDQWEFYATAWSTTCQGRTPSLIFNESCRNFSAISIPMIIDEKVLGTNASTLATGVTRLIHGDGAKWDGTVSDDQRM